jgi:aldehyde:ferredoxin oxidoreductase
MLNYKMGLSPRENRLFQVLMDPFSNGGSAGKTTDSKKLKKIFYKYRDWNPKTGRPLVKTK